MRLTSSSIGLTFLYTDKAKIPPFASRYLGAPAHPLYPKLSQIYAHRDRNTLWWRVSVGPLHQFKRVVRSWSARRARLAFRQALKRQGFDEAGKRIAGNGSFQPGALTGSLDIHVRPASVEQSLEQIQEDTELLLDDILAQLAEKTKTSPLETPGKQ